MCTHTHTHRIKKKLTVIKNKKWCFVICVCQSIFSFSVLCIVFSSFFLVRLVNYLLKLLYCFVCFFSVTHCFLSLLCLTLPLPCLSFASVSLWAYTGLELILQPWLASMPISAFLALGFPARVPMPSFERPFLILGNSCCTNLEKITHSKGSWYETHRKLFPSS